MYRLLKKFAIKSLQAQKLAPRRRQFFFALIREGNMHVKELEQIYRNILRASDILGNYFPHSETAREYKSKMMAAEKELQMFKETFRNFSKRLFGVTIEFEPRLLWSSSARSFWDKMRLVDQTMYLVLFIACDKLKNVENLGFEALKVFSKKKRL